jgi:hypothetical protein
MMTKSSRLALFESQRNTFTVKVKCTPPVATAIVLYVVNVSRRYDGRESQTYFASVDLHRSKCIDRVGNSSPSPSPSPIIWRGN